MAANTETPPLSLAPLSPELAAKLEPVRELMERQHEFALSKPPVLANSKDPGHLALQVQTSDPETRVDVLCYRMAEATGTPHLAATSGIVADLQGVVAAGSVAPATSLNIAMAHMMDIAPRDGLEGMLAAQMVAVRSAAMEELANAQADSQPTDIRTARVNRAAKLLRLFTLQMETLNKHRGKAPSEQHVTVEHVHVHDGGQAVVGVVSASKARGGRGED